MLAQLEAFAVEDGVPAIAAAHGINAAVQVPAAIRVGVKELVLAFVGFEVVHTDADQADGHAANDEISQQLTSALASGEDGHEQPPDRSSGD